ncbi:MAG: DNA methyltransferase [Methanolinea sp.]|jgi:site-specific DNA-methyltransferase (adenine-specific)|nr:DNA methyltransferase [Methanolinea sp.]
MSTLVCGDCNEGMARMRSGSVDIIFTDPPYIKNLYAEAYQVLARHAGRLLVPGGYLVSYCPQFHLPVILRILDGSGLAYFWLCAQLNSGAKTIVWSRNAMCGWKPVVIYQKPPVTAPNQIFIDVLRGVRAKAFHPWQQSIHETLHLLSRLAAPGALVLDPYAGTGTNLIAAQLLGMNYHGFEIDPATYRIAQDRLTQRPLDLAVYSEATT